MCNDGYLGTASLFSDPIAELRQPPWAAAEQDAVELVLQQQARHDETVNLAVPKAHAPEPDCSVRAN